MTYKPRVNEDVSFTVKQKFPYFYSHLASNQLVQNIIITQPYVSFLQVVNNHFIFDTKSCLLPFPSGFEQDKLFTCQHSPVQNLSLQSSSKNTRLIYEYARYLLLVAVNPERVSRWESFLLPWRTSRQTTMVNNTSVRSRIRNWLLK